jgi:hypothetical protein
MAGWIAAFKVIPWAELIVAAPAVVKGAQKLWATVTKQETPALSGQDPVARQRALEAQVGELRRELMAASELVKNLAEQNSRLVSAVEILRLRTRVLFLATVIMAAALILLAIVVLFR